MIHINPVHRPVAYSFHKHGSMLSAQRSRISKEQDTLCRRWTYSVKVCQVCLPEIAPTKDHYSTIVLVEIFDYIG